MMRFNQSIRKITILLFFSCFYCQADDSAAQLYSQLNEQAVRLNGIINQYQNGVLSYEDQKEYVDILFDFQIEMQSLKELGVDTSHDEQVYLNPYMQSASILVTDPGLLATLTETSKSDVPGKYGRSFQELRAQKITELYNRMADAIVGYQEKFNQSVSQEITALGKYSKNNQHDFLIFLNNEQRSFVGSVKAEQTSIKGDYFSFLERNVTDFSISDLDDIDHNFVQGVTDLAQDANLCIQAFMVDITSRNVKANVIEQLSKAFAESDLEMQRDYEREMKENQEQFDKTWFQDLKGSGQALLKKFSIEFQKEFAGQVQKAITKKGGEIAKYWSGEVISYVKGVVPPALDDVLPEYAKKLQSENFLEFLHDKSSAARALKFAIRQNDAVVKPTMPVKVTQGVKLSTQEKNFRKNRFKKYVMPALSDLGITQPLTLAFCCSGGGVRAMVGTLGLFTAAARAKILQASMYMAGLSGSTWLITPWAYYGQQKLIDADFLTSLNQVRANLYTTLDNPNCAQTVPGVYLPAPLAGQDTRDFSYQIASSIAFNDAVSVVDLFGALIGKFALDLVPQHKLDVAWSTIAKNYEQGAMPLPLCSAVFDAGSTSPVASGASKAYEWFETSPFQAGSDVLGYVPIKYFGSVYANGVLQTTDDQLRPEYPLSFYLGVYGSAFSLSVNDAIDKGLPNPKFKVGTHEISVPVNTWVRNILDQEAGNDVRGKRAEYLHTIIANYSLGVPTSAMKNKETITLVDGGMNFNFPLPMLLDRPERNVDIVIMYDSNPGDAADFHRADAYFKRKGIAIPDVSKVTKTQLISKVMTVFNDPGDASYDKSMPTFIYFPTRSFNIKVAPYITPNFKYTAEQLDALADDIDKAFTSQVDDIVVVMKKVAKARHG
jgi:hypothetical protein